MPFQFFQIRKKITKYPKGDYEKQTAKVFDLVSKMVF